MRGYEQALCVLVMKNAIRGMSCSIGRLLLPAQLVSVARALALSFIPWMIPLGCTSTLSGKRPRCRNLYPLDGFGPDRTLLPPDQRGLLSHSCSNCQKRMPEYISSDCACWIYDLLTSTVHHCWCHRVSSSERCHEVPTGLRGRYRPISS